MTPNYVDHTPAVATSSDFHAGIPSSLENSESSESSFSDAYNEDAEVVNVKNNGTAEVDDDDYAMTFDSDGEENTNRQDIQEVSVVNDDTGSKSLPLPVSTTKSSSIIVSQESAAPKLPNVGSSSHPPHFNLATVNQASDTSATNLDVANAAQFTIEPLGAKSQVFDEFTAGGIDIQQLLDNITANAEKPESPHLKNHSLPIHASLPPRPNVPQNRNFQDEGPKFYPGAAGLPPASTSYRPPGGAPSIVAAGAPGTSTDPRGGLPPPPTASFHGPLSLTNSTSPASYTSVNRSSVQDLAKFADNDEADDPETKWAPEVQRMYDEFLEDERRYVTEGLWDRFPMGSRLFIGNLPSEKVTKRDLFHIFHHYGKIAQISIKQAYGFVQFLHSDHCYKSLDCEQGAEVRGRKMHLEISKPQKNTRNAQHGASSSGQRAKSPDRTSGGRNNRGNDRYERSAPAVRADEYGRPIRTRDDYRPVRSVTPPRSIFRGRDAYVPNGRDPYDTRERRRSISPYGQRDVGRYRARSPSPRSRGSNEDFDLQIPHRDPRDVPDVQIILMEQLDRQFVTWVETEMRSRGIKVEVMFLSPRVPIEAVIRRQILEGVHAVSRLDVLSQNSSKIPLQVFDRQGGANNVRFDEYQDLEPRIAGELVLRTKQKQVPLQSPAYSQVQYFNQSYQPPATTAAPNLANLVGSLDNATLQKLLESLSTTQQQQDVQSAATPVIDLAGLLGGLKQQSATQAYVPPTPPVDYYRNGGHKIQSGFFNSNPQSSISQNQPPQPALQVQNIMAQLARFRK